MAAVTNSIITELTFFSEPFTVSINTLSVPTISTATPSDTPTVDEDLQIDVTLSDAGTFDTRRLFYRPAGATTYSSTDVTPSSVWGTSS